MPRSGEYVAVYDVTDDVERARVDRALLGYGFRVQKSVFECRLTRSTRERLLAELTGLDLQTGHVLVYRLQHGSKPVGIGQVPEKVDDEFAFFV